MLPESILRGAKNFLEKSSYEQYNLINNKKYKKIMRKKPNKKHPLRESRMTAQNSSPPPLKNTLRHTGNYCLLILGEELMSSSHPTKEKTR